ncbi:MAG: T9SS type A sorting domain-containing protein [Bacteroidales bacterium]|jgi:hypothetical protein|nr:T9SS type A sorting domain-containing protein [Bacteroidales bacterium]
MKNYIKCYLIISLVLIAGIHRLQAQNQNYIPMVNPATVWFETYSFMPSPYGYNNAAKLYFDGDTTFNNKQYQKLYKIYIDVLCQQIIPYEPTYYGALREDSLTQKVWIVEWDTNDEILFFDFSIQVGDTIPEDCYFSRNFYPLTVSNVDTVSTYDGLERRKWQFFLDGWDFGGSEVIEGIGSINGLLAGFIIPVEYYWEQLFCFSINNSHIYPNPNPYNCILPSDTCMTVGIEPETEWHDGILVYPNPVNSNLQLLHIKFLNNAIKIKEIAILSCNGKMIYKSNYNDNYIKLDLSDMTSGFYILRIITKKHIYYKKIQIQ